MAFQKTWRAYQRRLLDHFDSYLEDRRFHVVAAPGSGKTVLGLEAIRRIDQPALVLAPTITIRDQWVDRLVDCFLPRREPRPSWVSTDLRAPGLLTVATYQALHSLCCGHADQEPGPSGDDNHDLPDHNGHEFSRENDVETARQLPLALAAGGFRTLVVDEAHHLRAEWWKTLNFVVEQLEEPTIIALTATPPYDVAPAEWQRYQDLCGAVDAQVSVPELVFTGDLCPHQDYVYFSTPQGKEQQQLSNFRAAIDSFIQRLRATAQFKDALLTHPWMLFPDGHVEAILDRPEYLSSMVVYLQACAVEISPDIFRILGLSQKQVPALDLEWLEILLSNCLYADAGNFSMCEGLFKSFRHELQAAGAIERQKVKLRNPVDSGKLLASSVTKLKSIEEIVWLESGAQGERLRLVVLADFIRKSEMPSQDGELGVFEDIGVVPIFETLRRARVKDVRLGVLSGSLVLIPKSAGALLRSAARAAGIRSEDLALFPLPYDADYLRMELRGEHYQGAVPLITSVFEQGGITVLVGTKSLLGEGWDAPSINTLVLASFVGSYVLSNQMRGRSIRVDPNDVGKTANIWHLVCLEPGPSGPGEDYHLLVRRCRAFAGLNASTATIESGTERLGLGRPPFSAEQISRMNDDACRRARDRDGLRQGWQKALSGGENRAMVDGLKFPDKVRAREFVMGRTISSLLFQSGSVSLAAFLQLMRDPSGVGSAQQLLQFGALAAGASAVLALPWTLTSLWRFVRHASPERSIRQIGRAVVESLIYEGSIRASGKPGKMPVHSEKNADGTLICWIEGKAHEQTAFVRALNESLGPVESPRYLLAQGPRWHVREDYFAVPEAMARKKEFAEVFAEKWQRHVGPVQLVHTRTPEGRKLLLRARVRSLAASFQKRSEHISCWK
jgi:superfamily II DNA or RNA helicase